jgi:hypothetical protein
LLIYFQSVSKHDCHRQSLFLIGWFLKNCLLQVRVITVFTVFRLLTDFVCLYNYEFWLSLCKIVRSSVICYYPYWLISKKIFFSEIALPNESKLGRNRPWKVIYKDCAFSSHPLINISATGHSCFWLVDF